MIVKRADFICSSPRVEICPELNVLEFAFIGRSNVGKSSLINMLTNRNSLAKVSGTPGKTQMINHFEINSEWYLVDLPGYGYARVAHSKKQRFSLLIEGYITQRENLHLVFLLIDSRHAPQKIDIEFMKFLGENGIPFMIIFTKIDKLSKLQLTNNLEIYEQEMMKYWEEMPKYFVSSSQTSVGKDEILDCIDQYVKEDLKSKKIK